MACRCVDQLNDLMKPNYEVSTTLHPFAKEGEQIRIHVVAIKTKMAKRNLPKEANIGVNFCPICGTAYKQREAVKS